MNAVIAALKAAGRPGPADPAGLALPADDAQGDVTAYVADNTVSAKAKIAGAGALIDAAVAAGANTVSGPSLGVSDRDARYRDALGKAVADARLKAEALAKAGGFGVGPVSTVTEQGAPEPVFRPRHRQGLDTDRAGTQDITADVTVTFRIR